ncbi:subtilisin-like serine protease [Halovivax asiaticus JCM 14624]|uniref:Subtilisin-like serine protease n=1 Tax=Halovivax asiaticus JCM 14624 TaxID=1227490 RepID=M0BHW7_9EURY|nr:S8 family serine peptidase [Halovivax asiaticus]ELZ09249.1 subtilisin-like serine protease [Halovivax asiaticus JCM 14624]
MALVFAILMVSSMPAMAFAGGNLGGETTQADLDNSVEMKSTAPDATASVEISDELLESEERIEAIVRFEDADLAAASTAAEVESTLKSTAENTQADFTEWAGETQGVAVQNDFWVTNAVLISVDTDAAREHDLFEEMANKPHVERIHENMQFSLPGGETADGGQADGGASASELTPSPQNENVTYGLDQINATETWSQFGTQGEGAKIAVLDTGVDVGHPDLDLYTEDESDPTYPGGWAEFDSNGDQVEGSEPHDSGEHGTHVTGTVSGAEDTAGDVPSYGVAPEADIMHGMVLPGGSGSFAQIAGGIEWAAEEDADVVSMSLGASGYNGELIDVVENANDAGTLVIAAIGNQGPFDPAPPGYSGSPGNYYSSFGVGAVDANADVASFSLGEHIDTADAWGDDAPDYWPDQYTEPAVAAPGVDVLSSIPGGDYDGSFSGTSMATPHVAGAVGLMVSASGGAADNDMIVDALEETAWKPDDWDQPEDERDNRYGSGIIDVPAATALVALDSGINGTVTDSSGEPIEGATVSLDAGQTVQTDGNGSYQLLAQPDTYEVTANGFGYAETNATVEIPDNETFVEQDFELADGLGINLLADQPEDVNRGDSFNVTADVANVETITIDNLGGYDGDLTLTVNGEEVTVGEPHDFDEPFTGELTIVAQTDSLGVGDIELHHTFDGLGDQSELTTGPTTVFEDVYSVAVLDDSSSATDTLVSRIEDNTPGYVEVDAVYDDAGDALANDPASYDGWVVHNIPEDDAEAFVDATDDALTGVVWMDQWGSGSNAVPSKSAAVGNPAETDQGFSAPNPSMEILADHPIFDGVGEPGEEVQLHTAGFADTTWFDGYDGQVIGNVQSGSVTDGSGLGIDAEKQSVLLTTSGLTTFVGAGDYTAEADAIFGNAVTWAAEPPHTRIVEDQLDHVAEGDDVGATFDVEGLEKVSTSLHESSTIDQDDLMLYLDGSVNAFDEWRSYPDYATKEDYTVHVEVDDGAVGSVVLEHTFVDRQGEEIVLTTGPTAVYDAPLDVPGDVGTIQEAVDLAPDGAEIVVADGTYEEAVTIDETRNLTLTSADGATPTIVAPEDASGDTVSIGADGVSLSGFDVDAGGNGGVAVTAADATVTDVSVSNASSGISLDGATGASVSDSSVSDAATGIAVSDSQNSSVTNAEVSATDIGVGVADSEFVDVSETSIDAGEHGIGIDGADAITVTNNSVTNASVGIGTTDSAVDTITGTDATDVGVGIGIDGGSVAAVTENSVTEAETAIAVENDASVADLSHNEVTNTTTGLSIAGSFTSVDATMNAIAAETGIETGDVSSDRVSIGFNDLEATETAIAHTGEDALDARHNWFGDRGPVANNGVSGDVVYDPFLTEVPDGVDENTTEIAVDVVMDEGGTYTIGVPGTTDQTVSDVFGDDFGGTAYGYDSGDGKWNQLNDNHDLSSLSAILVTDADAGAAVLDFQVEDDFTLPGSENLNQGWNLVSPTAYTETADGFGNSNSPDNVHVAYEHGSNHLGETVDALGDEYDGDAEVNPFGGYWVHIESEDDEYQHSVDLERNPTTDEIYSELDLLSSDDDDGDDGPTLPDEVNVAVVDETNYHEGAIESVLDERLDSRYTVETLTADQLVDSMGDYDVFVVQRFGSDELAQNFTDALGSDQATIYLDSYQGGTSEAYADGVYRLHNIREDPAVRTAEATATDGEPVELDIDADHPIFEDIGSAGDTVTVYDGSTTWGAWFDDYSGTVLADGDWSAGTDGEHEGGAVAVDADRNEILNTAIARDYFTDGGNFTDAGNQLLANSVEHGADLAFGIAPAGESETSASATAPAIGPAPTGAIVG